MDLPVTEVVFQCSWGKGCLGQSLAEWLPKVVLLLEKENQCKLLCRPGTAHL